MSIGFVAGEIWWIGEAIRRALSRSAGVDASSGVQRLPHESILSSYGAAMLITARTSLRLVIEAPRHRMAPGELGLAPLGLAYAGAVDVTREVVGQ